MYVDARGQCCKVNTMLLTVKVNLLGRYNVFKVVLSLKVSLFLTLCFLESCSCLNYPSSLCLFDGRNENVEDV